MGRWVWLCLGLLLGGGCWADGQVRLTNGDWPPYLSPDLPHAGLASRIVTAAFAEQHITVEYGFFPWARAYQLAKKGAWDGSLLWLKSPEREKDFYFSMPVIKSDYVFFYRKDMPFDWQTLADVRPYRIGVSDGYDYGARFKKMQQQGLLTFDTASSDLTNLRKLAAGRIDLFPVTRIVGLSLLRQLSVEEAQRLTFHPRKLQVQTMHLILNRKQARNQQLIAEFNQGLATLRARGDLQRFEHEMQLAPLPER